MTVSVLEVASYNQTQSNNQQPVVISDFSITFLVIHGDSIYHTSEFWETFYFSMSVEMVELENVHDG